MVSKMQTPEEALKAAIQSKLEENLKEAQRNNEMAIQFWKALVVLIQVVAVCIMLLTIKLLIGWW